MTQKVLEAIDRVVEIIYTIDQNGIDQMFADFLDELQKFLKYAEKKEYHLNLMPVMLSLQDAYLKKDYTLLADLLLYDLRIHFLTLSEE